MARGRLRVLLGAAPGVGKTCTMLEEGRRLRAEGNDVVIGLLETHGREATRAAAAGLEVVPRRRAVHRSMELEEMDVEAILERRPQTALVDELAHTNAEDSRHAKRWSDVLDLLDAGIDVITTVNIQHIESLHDVVEKITGIAQRETVPDHVLRQADEVEVVDLTPQSLRDRLAAGRIYPAERIDASLSNYFRTGNLIALRELALLWVADEVDFSLNAYRADHGITGRWEARERVVVALTGGPEGEALLRRGARIASRSGRGQLMAVHVIAQDGLRELGGESLASQRRLAEELGGTYHQIVGENVAASLVDLAKSTNATQLVIGVSRRGRLSHLVVGSTVRSVVALAEQDLDVHLVNHAAASRPGGLRPPRAPAVSARRRAWGFFMALAGGPLLTLWLVAAHTGPSVASEVVTFQVLIVATALVGGFWPALFAAVGSGLSINYFFIPPLYTITIAEPRNALTLVLHVVVAVLVSYVVDRAARLTRAARRASEESEVLATVAGSVLRGENAAQAIVERAREAFGMSSVRLVDIGRAGAGDGEPRVIAASSEPTAGTGGTEPGRAGGAPGSQPDHGAAGPAAVLPVGERAKLELSGPDLSARDRRILSVLVVQLEAALEHRDLEETVSEYEPLAASDRARTVLLATLGHDLRRPLASARAAVSGLGLLQDSLSREDREELVATADESLEALAALIHDLLDVSRLESGVLPVDCRPTDLADVVTASLDELGLGPEDVELDLGSSVPRVLADPALLQRVLSNLLLNAVRHSPAGTPLRITTSAFGESVEIRVLDRGPGIDWSRSEAIFTPFQREGDTDNTAGLGLGLAISKGFAEVMGGSLTPEPTPGGGLTMVVGLRAAGTDETEEGASS